MLKSLPQRSCIGCNIKKDKKELIRVVKDKDGNISIDKTGKANGRGAYICNNVQCLEKAIKSKRLERTFEKSIDAQIYENLRGVIIDK
ncbi:MAG: YlxR family protein [Clostridia bacterium]|nr:YlxR family protein [Clostridia bacterium]